MLNWRYARLLWRYLWRRFLTPAGWRWKTDGPVFFGKNLQLQIGKRAEIRFGRFSWIGDGTKIRCHEGVVENGAKTIFGQECTSSAGRGGLLPGRSAPSSRASARFFACPRSGTRSAWAVLQARPTTPRRERSETSTSTWTSAAVR